MGAMRLRGAVLDRWHASSRSQGAGPGGRAPGPATGVPSARHPLLVEPMPCWCDGGGELSPTRLRLRHTPQLASGRVWRVKADRPRRARRCAVRARASSALATRERGCFGARARAATRWCAAARAPQGRIARHRVAATGSPLLIACNQGRGGERSRRVKRRCAATQRKPPNGCPGAWGVRRVVGVAYQL